MEKPLEEAILKTLVYANIFDYPLKEKEIWQRLISESGISPRPEARPEWNQEFRMAVRNLCHNSLTGFYRGYYFLPRRKKIVQIRQVREKWSHGKLKKAQQVASLLKFIPTVKMVAVTGNLAVENCKRDDDIDLLIVASPGTLWLTRFLATFLLEIIGQRRRPGQKNVRDKICLNMFLDEDHLQIPQEEQDLYVAHEVVQLKPLWERDRTCQKFLVANLWVKKYLPNGMEPRVMNYKVRIKKTNSPLKIIESFCRWLQLWYMKNRRTTEVVTEGTIRFHPQDVRPWVLKEFGKKLRELPLDK